MFQRLNAGSCGRFPGPREVAGSRATATAFRQAACRRLISFAFGLAVASRICPAARNAGISSAWYFAVSRNKLFLALGDRLFGGDGLIPRMAAALDGVARVQVSAG